MASGNNEKPFFMKLLPAFRKHLFPTAVFSSNNQHSKQTVKRVSFFQGENQDKRGIYIKSVVPGGAAALVNIILL